MSNLAAGMVTPQDYVVGLLSDLEGQTVSSEETVIARTLEDLSPHIERLGNRDLAVRIARVMEALRSGQIQRARFATLPLLRELAQLKTALEGGESIEAVLFAREAASRLAGIEGPRRFPKSITAREILRSPIGQPPVIHWEKFGTKLHPFKAPGNLETEATAGRRLAYALSYIAGAAGLGETSAEREEFFGMGPEARRKLDRGLFFPKALGNFPTEESHAILKKTAQIESLYGKLVQELMIQAIFESQGWSLGVPLAQATWDIHLLYGLRRYVAEQLLMPQTREKVLEDEALLKVVQGKRLLTDVRWHPGLTRREVFEPWLVGMNKGQPAQLERQKRFIGESYLRSWGWQAPKNEAGWELQLQWMVRKWIAHYHYGALPARGLPFSVDVIVRFAAARYPARVNPQFARKLLAMMGDYYSKTAIDALGAEIPDGK